MWARNTGAGRGEPAAAPRGRQIGGSLKFGEQIWDAGGNGAFMMAAIDGDGAAGYSFGDEQVGAFGFGATIASGGDRIGVGAIYQGHVKIHPDSLDYQTNEVTPSGVVGVLTTAGEYRWSLPLRPEYSADVSIQAMAFDGAGNLWVAGDFAYGTLAVGSLADPALLTTEGSWDAFLLKLSPDGELLLAERFGDEEEQSIYGIAADATGSVWLTGGFVGAMQFTGGALHTSDQDAMNMFVVKLDASGTWVWGRSFGDEQYQRFLEIQLDRDGNAVVGGEYRGTVQNLGPTALVHGGPGSGPVVAKFDPDGKVLWAREWACDGYCGAYRLAVDDAGQTVAVLSYGANATLIVDGQAFVGGPAGRSAVVKLDREGDSVWVSEPVPGGPEVAVDASGAVVLAGDYTTQVKFAAGKFQLDAGPGDTDLYVVKMRP